MHSSLLSASPPVTRTGKRVGNGRVVARSVAAAPSPGGSSLEETIASRTSFEMPSSYSNSVAFSAPMPWTSPSSGGSSSGSGSGSSVMGHGASGVSNRSPSIQTVGFDATSGVKEGREAGRGEKAAAAKGLLSLRLGNSGSAKDVPCVVAGTPLQLQGAEKCPWELKSLQDKSRAFRDPLVVQAYHIAASAHFGQVRKNGEPVLAHCTETALILSELFEDPTIIAAALLHDVLDDTSLTEEELSRQIPQYVCNLVKKVSSISYLSQLAREHRVALHRGQSSKLKDMLVGTSDCRAVVIKLADRLHNLRTISVLPFAKQARIAEETMQVFVPLAGRLGCWTLKSELEDLCFRIEFPQEYKNLKAQYDEFIRERESSHLMAVLNELKAALDDKGIEYEDIVGRPKNLYGVYKKMMKRRITRLTDVHDLLAVRVIVPQKECCYSVLRVIHDLWQTVEGRYKNFIREPKENGYQSLHDVVLTSDGVPFEVQIRTTKMHHIAECGMAAHWRYKEQGEDGMVPYVQQMLAWSRLFLADLLNANDRKARPEGLEHSGFEWLQRISSFAAGDAALRNCKHHASYTSYPIEQLKDAPVLAAVRTAEGPEVCQLPPNTTVETFLLVHGLLPLPASSVPLVNGTSADMSQIVGFGDLVEVSDPTKDHENEDVELFSFSSIATIAMSGEHGGLRSWPLVNSGDKSGVLPLEGLKI